MRDVLGYSSGNELARRCTLSSVCPDMWLDLMPVTAHLFLQLTPRLLDAYQNVSQLSLVDAILRFLQIWQALPDFGISYVVVRLEF